jgi:hypothetical protein
MVSVGLTLFDRLCASVHALESLRDAHCPPGSDQWAALTTLVYELETLIDTVVLAFPDEEAGYPESPVTEEPTRGLHDCP